MALQSPRRLPRRLNRSVNAQTRLIARKHCRVYERRSRRRHETWMQLVRSTSRMLSVIASESRVWLLISGGIIVVTVVAALLFSPFFDVREITVRRQDPRVDPEEIQQLLRPLFRQRLLLVTKGQVASLLQSAFPDIDRIDISKSYPSTLTIALELEPVVASVTIDDGVPSTVKEQSGSILQTGSGGYAYLTAAGTFVVSPIALSREKPLPQLQLTNWGIRPQSNTHVVSAELIERAFAARDLLRTEFGLQPRETLIDVRAQEFHIRTDKTTLWFDLRSTLSVQFERFRAFLKTLSLDQAKEYIDLRVTDKIVYK
jgi:hypothetical protein